jgi:predicted RNA methylase
MISSVARTLKPLIPSMVYRSWEMHAARRNAVRWLEREGVLSLAVQVADRFDYRVQSGPFAGMRYTPAAVVTRHATPALLGVYERQIYPFLESAIERAELVVDVGCAEGYYAVGLALRGKNVVAFDADPHERKICREMAAGNGVSNRVTVRSWCNSRTLASLVEGRRALIISDIEGGEWDLFDSEVIAAIPHCDLVVELHGTAGQNEEFVKRFPKGTQVLQSAATIAGADRLAFLGKDAERMAAEYRPPQQWLVRAGD